MEMRGQEGGEEKTIGGKREGRKTRKILRARAAPRREEGGKGAGGEMSTPLSIPHRCLQMSPCWGRLGT